MNDLVNLLQPITLEEMDGVKLMNRIDTKYVTTQTRRRIYFVMRLRMDTVFWLWMVRRYLHTIRCISTLPG